MTELPDFPDYSDLGGVSGPQREGWDFERMRRMGYRHYLEGHVFDERVPGETLPGDEAPLLFPVQLNLVKILCQAQADALFGEWEGDVVRFQARQDVEENAATKAGIELAMQIMEANDAATLLSEAAMEREAYGGTVLKISPDLPRPGHVRFSRVDIDQFYPVWNPDDPDDLLEVYTTTTMTREQARALYHIETKTEKPKRVEHWSKEEYEMRLDNMRIDAFSGGNPWHVCPYVFIPRLRTKYWWGDALTPDLIPIQDELNMRVADLGEAINYNSHPIRWGLNMPLAFRAQNFPVGPHAFWDLGRVLGNSPRPEVGLLEAKSPVPERAIEFVKFIYDWGRTAANAPPIAFGEDNGGGQRSGRTLEIRMWPLIKATMRSRAYMGQGIQRAMKIAALILKQKGISDISVRGVNTLLDGSVVAEFAPMLPRDRAALVDEVVKLWTTPVPQISMETAQKLLGRGQAEVKRIRTMLSDKELAEFIVKTASDTGKSKPSSSEAD